MLPSTWKVPFDSSSFLSFPCSCKRFCRCCRELDSPAINPLKWLFPSLQLTVPSFPLALWKAEEWCGSYACARLQNSKRGGKETKHLQGLHEPLYNSSCSCAAFRPSIYLQGRKEHFFFFQVEAKAWSSAALQVNSLDTDHFSDEHSWELPGDLLVLSSLAAYCQSALEKPHLDGLVWKGPFYFGREKRTESLPGIEENVQYSSGCKSYH